MIKKQIDIEEVKQIANLARLSFNEQELKLFKKQFQDILGMIDSLHKVDTKGVLPLTHPLLEASGFAPDIPCSFDNTEMLIKAAADHTTHFFTVPSFTVKELKE